jgi:N6-L-threonylcarbamoyladenine synthase
LALVVSGGHTELVLVRGHGDYRVLGRTLDDAAGEAFDKVARLMGLPYPGGPALERLAQGGDPRRYVLPVAETASSLDFSFSGLKTAVRRILETSEADGEAVAGADLAASFQDAVVRALVGRARRAVAAEPVEAVLLAGGVSANGALRRGLAEALAPVPVSYPPAELCTDNAAMIAAAGAWMWRSGSSTDLDAEVEPGLALGGQVVADR